MGLKFRRGTTAQKSGSLAFGEPYVNTDLGTLQIGGANGDITLGSSGTGSTGAFGAISGSGLDITGNANIAGNLTLGGNITIGDNTSDTIAITANLSSSLIPSNDNVFNIGSTSYKYANVYATTISASAFTGLANLTTYSTSVDSRLVTNTNSAAGAFASASAYSGSAAVVAQTNANSAAGAFASASAYSGSAATTYAVLNRANTFIGAQDVSGSLNMTGSIIPGAHNVYSLGSTTRQWKDIYVSSGSIYMNGTAILSSNATDLTLTTDAGQSLKILETAADTITLQTAEGNLTLTSTGAGDVILDPNSGVVSIKGTLQVQDGNKITSSGGNTIQFGNNVAVTGSLITTGALTVGGNFVVNGTTTTIDSTTVNIGDNIIVLNGTNTTNGGIYVKDGAGASTLTGSMLWDTTNDKWIAGTLGNEIAILRATGDSIVSSSTQISISDTTGYTTFSSSVDSRLVTNTNSAAGAFASASAYSASIYTRDANQDTLITAASASAWGAFQSASSYSGSLATSISASNATAAAYSASIANNTITFNGAAVKLGGSATITATATNALTIGTGLSGTSYNGGSAVTIANSGVTSITTNTGLSTNASAVGGVTITNTGVTSNVAGTGVSVSGATGAVTISIGQAVATTDNVRFNSVGVGMAASATAGRIDAAGDVVAYSSSDKNFKENITPIENPIEKIRKISGNTYDWKADLKDVHGYEGNDVGVIAQEIEEVLPQIVTTRENGYKAVKYEKLVALLIEGIKAQQNQIDSLTIEIENLKKNNSL